MNLDEIPNGSLCVLDTNILLYAEQGASEQAKQLLRRISQREILAVLPQPMWLELSHKLMIAEALSTGMITAGNPARQLSQKPQEARNLIFYQDKIKALVRLGLGFEPCSRTDLFDAAFQFQKKYGLLTNDAVLLAVAVRLKADLLVTADQMLAQTREIPVCQPDDLRLTA